MSTRAIIVAMSLAAVGVALPATARAQTTDGALHLGLSTSVVEYTSLSGEYEWGALQTDVEASNTSWGFRENGVMLDVGYGLTDSIVLGGFISVGGDSDSVELVDVPGAEEQEESHFGLALGPRFDFMFMPGEKLRPYLTASIGLVTASSDVDDVETSLTGFQMQGGVGLRWFAASGFSVDPVLAVGWGTASGEVEAADAALGEADVSVSAFTVGLGIGFSGWII